MRKLTPKLSANSFWFICSERRSALSSWLVMENGVGEWGGVRSWGDLFVFSPAAVSAYCGLKSAHCGLCSKDTYYNWMDG